MNPWILPALSTAFALIAIGISFWRLKMPVRALRDMQLAIGDIEHDLESIRSTTRRLNARVGMRDARDKLHEQKPAPEVELEDEWAQRPEETADQWKFRIRRGPLRRGAKPGA